MGLYSQRIGVVLGLALAMACVQERVVTVGPEAGGSADVGLGSDLSPGPRDAGESGDPVAPADLEAGVDAAFDARDGLDPGGDSPIDGADAAPDGSDATGAEPVACQVAGVAGECIDVADCVGNRAPTPGHCPGPAEIQCCTPVDAEACDPEAMPLPNAGLEEAPGAGGCPAGMVPVGESCMDQFEAALVEVLEDGSTRPWSPYHNPGSRRVRAVSLAGAVPQGYINGHQSAAACAEAGKRLCSDVEWLRACRGASGELVYPYGVEQVAGWCNENREPHPVEEYFGTSADWIWSELGNACINQLPDSLAATGAYADCVSAEGVYDLVGNLHEWTAHPDGTFRGGYYVDTWRNGLACDYDTTAHNRWHWDYSTGFRCCADRD